KQQRVADAFLAAVRDGDFEALLAVLDPNVVLHLDGGTVRAGATRVVHGALAVAEGAVRFARMAPFALQALVNGSPGFIGRSPDGQIVSVMGMTIRDGLVVQLDALTDPERLAKLDLPPDWTRHV
ncbi:MAG: RNA polymerase subunit sigma-70, partial [Gemmatimonadaceae bacterium]